MALPMPLAAPVTIAVLSFSLIFCTSGSRLIGLANHFVCVYTCPQNMSNVKRLKRSGQTAEQVFHRLIEAILSGELPSGQPVPEVSLAQEWKVGRTRCGRP